MCKKLNTTANPQRPALFLIVLLSGLTGCTGARSRIPAIAQIYKEAAQAETRNPVIVIHGMLGSTLVQRSTQQTVWGAFTWKTSNPKTRDGAKAFSLPLVIPKQVAYDPAEEDVHVTGPLGLLKLGFVRGIIEVEIYANILRALGVGGYSDQIYRDPLSPIYADDHYTCFSFSYDWRRDNVANAMLLHRFIQEKRKEISRTAGLKIIRLRTSGQPEELREAQVLERWLDEGYKFDIVAHSMGGLIVRYYLRYGNQDLPQDGSVPRITWAGCGEIDRAILVGTPNFGSMEAFKTLIEGKVWGGGLLHYDAALIGSLPSMYQMMPRQRHGLIVSDDDQTTELDLYDPAIWRLNQWGLMSPSSNRYLRWMGTHGTNDEQRQKQAYAYLSWCLKRAKQFHKAIDLWPQSKCPSSLYLFSGDAEKTLSRVKMTKFGGRLKPLFTGKDLYEPGDTTVARYSAIGDERHGREYSIGLASPIPWKNVTFLSDDHMGLTRNPHFINNLLFILLEWIPTSVKHFNDHPAN
ncbi:MAG: hypothetical protein IID32_12135 [Planctomycetes bacterium]|nr:hypothetical protein [Planctomycetota bacterium]